MKSTISLVPVSVPAPVSVPVPVSTLVSVPVPVSTLVSVPVSVTVDYILGNFAVRLVTRFSRGETITNSHNKIRKDKFRKFIIHKITQSKVKIL